MVNFLGLHCNLKKKCRLRMGEGTGQTIVTKGIISLIGNRFLKVRDMVCLFWGMEGLEIRLVS